MDYPQAYRSLRLLLEVDRALGVSFLAKTPATAAAAPVITDAKPPPVPIVSGADAAARLAGIAELVGNCLRCRLCESRTHVVPGEGDPTAAIMFIGEAPGYDEDQQGRPFVGKAGQLLDRMIQAMGLRREEVYICNILKCRPPNNRRPEPHEAAACRPYLDQQIAAIKPAVICTLGNTPLRVLRENEQLGITRERGKRFEHAGIPVIPTFHPSYLLRNEAAKKPCWEDLKQVLTTIGRSAPKA